MQRKSSPLHRRYFAGAKAIMAELGLTPLTERPADSLNGPSAEYEAMTVAGRLRIHVHDDWTHMRFDRTELMVGHWLHGANKHSGKWNFHTFLDQTKRAERTVEFVDGHLDDLCHCLGAVKVAPFIRRPVTLAVADVIAIGEDALLNRAAMGEAFTISDFDKKGASEWAYRTVLADGQSEVIARFSETMIAGKGDLEAYFTWCRYRAHVNAAGEIVA